MTKPELIAEVAFHTGLTQRQAALALGFTFRRIAYAVKREKRFFWPGFGTFRLARHRAHRVANPATGKLMVVPAQKTIRFRASKLLKERF